MSCADRVFFENSGGGLTVSGGEPVTQFDFLQASLKEAGRRHIHRTLETNGRLPWDKFSQLLPELDLVLLYVKHLDPRVHELYTGADNIWIQNNLEQLARTDPVPWLPRIPLIPGMNDGADYLTALGERLTSLGVREGHLLPYHRLGGVKRSELGLPPEELMAEIEPPTEAEVSRAADILAGKGLTVIIGG